MWRTPATQTQLFPCTSTAHPSPSARDSRRGQDRHTIVKSLSTQEMGRRCFRVTNITPESVNCGVPCTTKVSTAILCTVIYMSFLCSLYAVCFVSQHFHIWTSVILQILIIICDCILYTVGVGWREIDNMVQMKVCMYVHEKIMAMWARFDRLPLSLMIHHCSGPSCYSQPCSVPWLESYV